MATVGRRRTVTVMANPTQEGFIAGTLTRWDPFGELSELRSRFDCLFGE